MKNKKMIIVIVVAVIAIAFVIYFFKKKKATELASRPTTPTENKIQNESIGTPSPAPAPIVPTRPVVESEIVTMSAAPNPFRGARTPAPAIQLPRGS